MSVRPALAETIFRRARRAAGDPSRRAGRAGDPDHRLALLAGGDEPALVRRALAPRAHVDRHRGRRGRRGAARAAWACSPQDTPVVITPTGILRRATPADVRRAARADLPARARLHLRPGRRRQRPCRSRSGGLRRLGGPQHGLPRCGRDRRPGRCELADRELRGLPERHLRRRPDLAHGRPGAAARGPAERALRGRGPARRRQLPRGRPQGRQRDPHARGDRRLGGARTGAWPSKNLERFEGAGVYYAATDLEARVCDRRARDGRRRRQLGRAGRDLPRPERLRRDDRDPPREPRRRRCRSI